MAKIPGAVGAGTAPQRVSPWEQLLIGLISSAPDIAMGVMNQKHAGRAEQREIEQLKAEDVGAAARLTQGIGEARGNVQDPVNAAFLAGANQLVPGVFDIGKMIGNFNAVPKAANQQAYASVMQATPGALARATPQLTAGMSEGLRNQSARLGMQATQQQMAESAAAASRAEGLYPLQVRSEELLNFIREKEGYIASVQAENVDEITRLGVQRAKVDLTKANAELTLNAQNYASSIYNQVTNQYAFALAQRGGAEGIAGGATSGLSEQTNNELSEIFAVSQLDPEQLTRLAEDKLRGVPGAAEKLSVALNGGGNKFARLLAYDPTVAEPLTDSREWLAAVDTQVKGSSTDPALAALKAQLSSINALHDAKISFTTDEALVAEVSHVVHIYEAYMRSLGVPATALPSLTTVDDIQKVLGVPLPPSIAAKVGRAALEFSVGMPIDAARSGVQSLMRTTGRNQDAWQAAGRPMGPPLGAQLGAIYRDARRQWTLDSERKEAEFETVMSAVRGGSR